MLSISQARRLSTIAQNKREARDDEEYDVLCEWERAAVDMMCSDEFLNLMFDYIDSTITAAAQNSQRQFQLVRELRGIYAPLYTVLFGWNRDGRPSWSSDVKAVFEDFNFMDVNDEESVVAILWCALTDIVFPAYEADGYQVEYDHPVGTYGSGSISHILSWQ